MLSMLLLLAAAPQTVVIPAAPAPPRSVNAARLPVLSDAAPGCASELRRASDPTRSGNGLMWREGGEPVGHYLLLDRRVNGCPDPVIVNYRVPGSNALGREARREPSATVDRRP